MELAADDYRVAYSMNVYREDPATRPSRSDKKSGSKSRRSSKGSSCSKKAKKNLALSEITQSLHTNCCDCCVVFAAYMKEAGKLVSSCLNESPTETKLCELFSELMAVASNIGCDFLNFLKYLYRLLIVINKKKCD